MRTAPQNPVGERKDGLYLPLLLPMRMPATMSSTIISVMEQTELFLSLRRMPFGSWFESGSKSSTARSVREYFDESIFITPFLIYIADCIMYKITKNTRDVY